MRVIDSEENSPAAELEAKVHQHHRGLTAVMLRRKGRAAFKSVQLEGKDGGSVGHREPPTDKPADISRIVWSSLSEHAARVGSGSYEVELVFASADKGPPPKAVVIPLAVGQDVQDIGTGTDPAVIVDMALRLAGFSTLALGGFMGQLPAIARATTENIAEVRALGEKMLEAIRNAHEQSDKVAVARIEADASAKRLEFAKEFVEPGMLAIREALGGGGAKTLHAAAATARPQVSTPGAELTPEQKHVDELQRNAVEIGRKLSTSMTSEQLDRLKPSLGAERVSRIEALRTSTTHADVLTLGGELFGLGGALLGVLELLAPEQVEMLDALKAIGDELARGGK